MDGCTGSFVRKEERVDGLKGYRREAGVSLGSELTERDRDCLLVDTASERLSIGKGLDSERDW